MTDLDTTLELDSPQARVCKTPLGRAVRVRRKTPGQQLSMSKPRFEHSTPGRGVLGSAKRRARTPSRHAQRRQQQLHTPAPNDENDAAVRPRLASRLTPGLFGKAQRVRTPGGKKAPHSRKTKEVRELLRSAGKSSCTRMRATEYRLEVVDGGAWVSPCRRSARQQKHRNRADVVKEANARLAAESSDAAGAEGRAQQQQQPRTPSRHHRVVETDSPIINAMLEAAHFSYKPLGTSSHHVAAHHVAKSPAARKALRRLSGARSFGLVSAAAFRKQLRRRAIVASDMFHRMDSDANGAISKQEFVRGYSHLMASATEHGGRGATSPTGHGELRQAASAVFALLDSDRDGRITIDEFRVLYDREGLTELEEPSEASGGAMPKAVAKASLHGRKLGTAELTKLAQGLLAASYAEGGASLPLLFRRIDSDGSGCIEYDEFQHTLRRAAARLPAGTLDTEAIARLFTSIDIDGDGTIDLSELCAFVEHHAAASRGAAPIASPCVRRTSGVAWILTPTTGDASSAAAEDVTESSESEEDEDVTAEAAAAFTQAEEEEEAAVVQDFDPAEDEVVTEESSEEDEDVTAEAAAAFTQAEEEEEAAAVVQDFEAGDEEVTAEASEEDEEESISAWAVASYHDLQAACKALGIKANSKRATLVAALEAADEDE